MKVEKQINERIEKSKRAFEKDRLYALECLKKLKNNYDDDWLADLSSCFIRMDANNIIIQEFEELKKRS